MLAGIRTVDAADVVPAVRLALLTGGGAMFDEPPATPVVRGSRAASASSFRFTIGGMLFITALAAVLVAGLFAFPPVVAAAIAGLMSVCIPAALIGCFIYGGPAWRAFAVGMLLPKTMRVVGGAFSGFSAAFSLAEMRMYQQQMLLQRRRNMPGQPLQDLNAFGYFTRMAEYWDKLGRQYLPEETLFWGGSFIAGLATLFVQRHFVRRGQSSQVL